MPSETGLTVLERIGTMGYNKFFREGVEARGVVTYLLNSFTIYIQKLPSRGRGKNKCKFSQMTTCCSIATREAWLHSGHRQLFPGLEKAKTIRYYQGNEAQSKCFGSGRIKIKTRTFKK